MINEEEKDVSVRQFWRKQRKMESNRQVLGVAKNYSTTCFAHYKHDMTIGTISLLGHQTRAVTKIVTKLKSSLRFHENQFWRKR